MRIKGQKKKKPGITITVSKKAHAKLLKEANAAEPKKTIRAIFNIKNSVPEHE